VANLKGKGETLDLEALKEIVENDSKNRFDLKFEEAAPEESGVGSWWIKANQGHSIKVLQ
jgi:2'-phosphotransferase